MYFCVCRKQRFVSVCAAHLSAQWTMFLMHFQVQNVRYSPCFLLRNFSFSLSLTHWLNACMKEFLFLLLLLDISGFYFIRTKNVKKCLLGECINFSVFLDKLSLIHSFTSPIEPKSAIVNQH